MLNQIVNRLRGQLRIRAETAFPERVLNLCGAWRVQFWDLEREDETAFTCCLSRKDLRILRHAVRHTDCTLTVVGREGVPYFLGRFRRRCLLSAGAVLCAAAMLLGSFFICDFEVEGCETVTREEVLRALWKNGVRQGTFGLSLDGESLRSRVLLEVPELSWISVNVSGCRAYVQVRERLRVPEIADGAPANVVARRPGLVRKVQALGGTACVLPGDTVEAGELLISGVADTEPFGSLVLAGHGSVTARTWYTLSAVMPLEAPVKHYTGREKTGRALVFGGHRVNFFSNSSIQGGNYDKIATRTPWTFFGLSLPVTGVKEVFRFYETSVEAIPPEQAKAAGEALLTAYLHTLADPWGSVRSAVCTARRQGDALHVTLAAECEEEIGQSVPIYTEERGPGDLS